MGDLGPLSDLITSRMVQDLGKIMFGLIVSEGVSLGYWMGLASCVGISMAEYPGSIEVSMLERLASNLYMYPDTYVPVPTVSKVMRIYTQSSSTMMDVHIQSSSHLVPRQVCRPRFCGVTRGFRWFNNMNGWSDPGPKTSSIPTSVPPQKPLYNIKLTAL
jgi:hypothetical protein